MRTRLLTLLVVLPFTGFGQPLPNEALRASQRRTEPPSLTLTQREYTALDGLSSNCIYHIAQDANGFIWLATSKGLDRFDGRRFESHLFADMVQPEQRVAQVIIDFQAASDSLFILKLAQNWAFQGQDTLFGFLPEQPEVQAPPLARNPIRKARIRLDGKDMEFMRVNGASDSIALFDGENRVSRTFEHIPARPWHSWYNPGPSPSLAYRSSDSTTDLLYREGDTMRHFSSREFTHVPPATGEGRPFIQRFDSTGLWFFTMRSDTFAKGTLIRQTPDGTLTPMGTWEDWFGFPCPKLNHRMHFKQNPWNGDMWCFHDNQLTVVDQDGQQLFNGPIHENPQYGSLINTVHFEDVQQVWVGSCKGLNLIQSEPRRFESVFNVGSAGDADVEGAPTLGLTGCRGIVELGPDSFAFVTNGSGVRLHAKGEDRFLVDEHGRGAGLHFDGDSLFVASIEGLDWLDHDGRLQPVLDIELPTTIWALHRLGPHRWLLGGETVWLVDSKAGTIEPFGEHPDGPVGNVYQIETWNDTLWITSSSGIHTLVDGQRWARWHEVQQGAPVVMEAHHRLIDSRGQHWIGTASRGLLQWDPVSRSTAVWGIDLGLPSTTIYGGVEDQDGLLWFSSDNGLFSLIPETGDVTLYGSRDGLHETEFNRTGLHCGPSGTVYFSTIDGLVKFHPSRFKRDKEETPPLIITSLIQHDSDAGSVLDVLQEFNRSGQLVMQPDDDFVAIKFALLDYSGVPQRFRYRTTSGAETPSEWFRIDEPELNISGLPPGNTTIEIQHRMRGTTWFESGLVIPLLVIRPWYQDPLSLTLVLVSLGLLTWLVVFLRLRALRRSNARLEAMVEERTRNLQASLELQEVYLKEVHHRVKNNLQIIGSLLDLQAAREQSRTTRSALAAGRSRIESISLVHQHLYLHPEVRQVNLTDFITEYVQRVEEALLGDEEAVMWSIEGDDIQLGIEEAQPFGLLINELLTNSLRHALLPNRRLSVRINWREQESGVLVLEYADNGPGLPQGMRIAETESLGLRLVHRLTKQLKGEITQQSGAGSHWLIRLNCAFENTNR